MGSTTNLPLITASNALLLNGMAATSIDTPNTIVARNNSSPVGFQIGALYDDAGTTSYNVGSRQIFSSGGGPPIIDASNGLFRGPGGGDSIDTGNRLLKSGSGQVDVAWDSNVLINNFTGSQTVSWGSGSFLLSDGGGNPRFEWDAGNIFYAAGTQAWSIEAGQIYDMSGQTVLDILNRNLTNPSGVVLMNFAGSGISFPHLVTTYNNIATAGIGLIPVVADFTSTTNAASIAATSIGFTPTVTRSKFRVSVSLINSTAGTSGTVSCAITYKTPDGVSQSISPAGTLTVGVLGTFTQGSAYMITDGATNIKIATTVTAFVGNPRYDLYATLEKMN